MSSKCTGIVYHFDGSKVVYNLCKQSDCKHDFSEKDEIFINLTSTYFIQICEIFMDAHKGKIYTLDYLGNENYFYDSNTRLWVNIKGSYFIRNMIKSFMTKLINKYRSSFLARLNDSPRNSNDYETNIIILKLDRIIQYLNTFSYIHKISSEISRCIYSPTFFSRLDSQKNLLPILDKKCIDLSDGKIVKRLKSHFFSYELNVSMGDPECPIVSKFFQDILGDLEQVELLQKVLGSWIIPSIETVKSTLKHLVIFYGVGNNGASTIMRLLRMGLFSNESFKDNEHFNLFQVQIFDHPDRFDCISLSRNSKHNVSPLKKSDCLRVVLITDQNPDNFINNNNIFDIVTVFNLENTFVDNPTFTNEKKKDPLFIETLFDPENKHLSDIFAWMVKGSQMFVEKGF